MRYYVYILLCEGGSYYTGYARNVEERFKQHLRGAGARYTRMCRPLKIAYVEKVEGRGNALRRELEIKSLSQGEKRELAASHGGDCSESAFC